MDDIDITTPGFSLDSVPDLTEAINTIVNPDADLSDYTMYIWGAIIIVFIGLIFIYKFVTQTRRVTFQDKLDTCYGDVCHR
jgi:uncharacterized BrkB/YihY/UPF0761 family membrane protein